MRSFLISLGLASGAIGWAGLVPQIAWAQVTPDGSLSTTVTRVGNTFTINQGDRVGNNLFHSFGQLSVPTGGAAVFNNAADVQNIFSRVTGGSISSIDGVIRANGTANLFLLNPNGILFGPNASLNIGGSFLGTTASSVKFADGVEFSTVNPTGTPLLTVSAPIGLQMGTNPGAIAVNNTGHQLTGSFSSSLTNKAPSFVGLQVASGQTLALVGGNLTLDGGILTAPGGNVDLRAVGQQPTSSQVGLALINGRWQLTTNTVPPTGELQFLHKALVNVSGTEQGTVQLWGGHLLMQDGSVVWLENRGNQAFGAIKLQIANAIDLIGAAPNTILASGIYADAKSTGRASEILVNTHQLTLQEGGNIQSRTFANGDTGQVTVNAARINFFDSRADNIVGVIGSRTSGSGNGSDVTINTQSLQVDGGGSISSASNFGSGNSGNLLVNASKSIALSVFPGNVNDAIIGASAVSASANAGNITLNTARLSLAGGALISSSVYGAGKGGTITINAAESVTLSGNRFSSVRQTLEGSTIRTAGVLLPTRASLNLPDQVTGSAGDVIINTPRLVVTDGAEVAVRHDSVGLGGRLEINADRVVLDRNGRLTATTASGNGGNIKLQSNLLTLRHGSTITANVNAKNSIGNGGNITINSLIILGAENSDIIANAVGGLGGNINITTQDVIGLVFRNTLTPRLDLTNDITASSEFSVNGTVQINNLGVEPSSGLIELPVSLTDASQQIAQGCTENQGGSFVATGRGGIPQNPTQEVRNDRPWNDLRDPSAYRGQLQTQATAPKAQSTIVEASTLKQTNGQLELVAATERNLLMRVATCARAIDPAP